MYSLALGTGLRASELGSLTPERFDLSVNPPTATVLARIIHTLREKTIATPCDLLILKNAGKRAHFPLPRVRHPGVVRVT